MRNISVIFFLQLDHWFKRCRLKDFLARALDWPLFSGAESFVLFW